MSQPRKHPFDASRNQFRLRRLFSLTFFIAVLVAIPVLLRDIFEVPLGISANFLFAISPIGLLIYLCVRNRISGFDMMGLSLVLFVISLGMPAIGGDEPILGAIAFFYSFQIAIGVFINFGADNGFIQLLGLSSAMANVAFIIADLAHFLILKSGSGIFAVRFFSTSSVCFAIISLLSLIDAIGRIYIGCGLWVASPLALALGSWRMRADPMAEIKDKR